MNCVASQNQTHGLLKLFPYLWCGAVCMCMFSIIIFCYFCFCSCCSFVDIFFLLILQFRNWLGASVASASHTGTWCAKPLTNNNKWRYRILFSFTIVQSASASAFAFCWCPAQHIWVMSDYSTSQSAIYSTQDKCIANDLIIWKAGAPDRQFMEFYSFAGECPSNRLSACCTDHRETDHWPNCN